MSIDDNEVDTTWMGRAACADHPADLFFPDQGENDTAQEAKAICATCPVRVSCLDYAVVTGQRFGIWGGLTEKQRRPFRNQHLRQPNSDLKPLFGEMLRSQDPN